MPANQGPKRNVKSQQVARCLRIVDQLQSGVRRSVGELADELGVSRRTVFRDLHMAQEAGLGMRFHSREKRYVVESPLSIKPSSLLKEDWTLLLLAAHVQGLSMGKENRTRLVHVIARLLAQFSASVTNELSRAINSLAGDEHPVCWPGVQSPHFGDILFGLQQRRCLRIRYDAGTGEQSVQTKVTPHRLVTANGQWSLVGRSSMHRATRTFPLQDILQVEVLEEVFA